MEKVSTKWKVESVRVLVYSLSLLVLLFYYYMQSPFISWALLGPSFGALGLGLSVHLALFT
ncbi:MAG: hypothetical protein KDD45_14520, partial [Bdellovibrionales bacterium]|nr:hypothetical protein [Bdellovibrionales bacterium]